LEELEVMLPLKKIQLLQFEALVKRYSIQGTEIVRKKALHESFGRDVRFKDLGINLQEGLQILKR
jgi:hypothetical protein